MTESSTGFGYVPDKVSITATYPPPAADCAGQSGQPETVTIELNDDAVPADAAERLVLIASLVDSLFRDPRQGADVVVDPDPADAGQGETGQGEAAATAEGEVTP